VAQEAADEVISELSAMYAMYRIGDFCLTQGLGFTQAGLDNIRAAASGLEEVLNDEEAETELWAASAEEAGFVLATMSGDTSVARANCGQLNTIVGALATANGGDKPF